MPTKIMTCKRGRSSSLQIGKGEATDVECVWRRAEVHDARATPGPICWLSCSTSSPDKAVSVGVKLSRVARMQDVLKSGKLRLDRIRSQGRLPHTRSTDAHHSSSRASISTEQSLRGQTLSAVDEEAEGDSVEEEAGEACACAGIPYRPAEMLQVWLALPECRCWEMLRVY